MPCTIEMHSESQSCCDVIVPPAPRQQTTSSPTRMGSSSDGVYAHRLQLCARVYRWPLLWSPPCLWWPELLGGVLCVPSGGVKAHLWRSHLVDAGNEFELKTLGAGLATIALAGVGAGIDPGVRDGRVG